MDRGDWWAAIYGVAQSRTRLSSSSSMVTLSMTKEARIYNGGKVSSRNATGKTGQLHIKE